MNIDTPQFDPTKHAKVFRGVSLATGNEGDVNYSPNTTDYSDGCRICGKENPSNHTTGMHWSDTQSIASRFAEGSNTVQGNPGKIYEGFTEKSNVMSRQELDETGTARTHGIIHLSDDPPKDSNADDEREVPLRPGSTVYVTKTTDSIPTEKNPRKHHKIIVRHPKPIKVTIKRGKQQ